jgi:hypothetical protein
LANTAHTSQADLNKSHRSFLLPVDQENSSLTQLVKTYLPKREIDKVWEAYRFSEKAHSGQKEGVERLISATQFLSLVLPLDFIWTVSQFRLHFYTT